MVYISVAHLSLVVFLVLIYKRALIVVKIVLISRRALTSNRTFLLCEVSSIFLIGVLLVSGRGKFCLNTCIGILLCSLVSNELHDLALHDWVFEVKGAFVNSALHLLVRNNVSVVPRLNVERIRKGFRLSHHILSSPSRSYHLVKRRRVRMFNVAHFLPEGKH